MRCCTCSLRVQARRRPASPQSPQSPQSHRVLTAPRSSNMAFQLRVNSPSGEEKLIRLCVCNDRMMNVTVQQLKRIIQCIFQTGDSLELVFGAETLEEEALLLSCGVKHMSRIQSVVKLPGADVKERSGHAETNIRPNSSSLSETNITENK